MVTNEKICLVKLFLLISVCLSAQQLNFRYIGNEIDLPANECYKVIQSDEGYIWISTEAGLCVYNGKTCRLQLPKPVYATYRDSRGLINFVTNNNDIYTENKDTVSKAVFKQHPLTLFSNKLTFVYDVIALDTGLIYSGQFETVYYSKHTNRAQLLQNKFRDTSLNFYCSNTKLFHLKREMSALKELIRTKKKLNFRIHRATDEINVSVPFSENIDSHWRILCAGNNDGGYYIAVGNLLVILSPDGSSHIETFPDRILTLDAGKNKGIWIGVQKNGVYYFETGLSKPVQSLKGYSVTNILEDRENGIWCTTLEKGVFYAQNNSVVNYSGYAAVNGKCDLLKRINGSLFASAVAGKLLKIDGSNYQTFEFPRLANYSIRDIVSYRDGYIIAGNEFVVYVDDKFNVKKTYSYYGTGYNVGATALCNMNGKLLTSHFTGLKILDGDCFKLVSPLNYPGSLLNYNGKLYVAQKDGLVRFDTSNFRSQEINTDGKKFRKLLATKDQRLLALSSDKGIYEISGNDKAVRVSAVSDKVSYFYDFDQDMKGDFWIATNKGLFRLDAKMKLKHLYTSMDGMPANEVNKVCCDSEIVFYSTIEGLGSINTAAQISNTSPPPVKLKEIVLNDLNYQYTAPLVNLPAGGFSLKLVFDVLTFRRKTNAPLLYYTISRENDQNEIRQYEAGSQLVFDNLGPGRYTLRVYGVNNSGVRSSAPVVLVLNVPPPYWQTPWFIALVFLLVLLITALVAAGIVKTIKRKEQEKTRISKMLAEYQLTALQSQMNPHFIFNSINSIQNFILQKREKDAYAYLSKFAKLVRMVLHNSQKKTILLTEEINLIKTYIETEKMRFDDSFDFTLLVDEDLSDREIILPPMLLQPYIENAIWHGLMHLETERKGQLLVKFAAEDGILKITIEDNGIGRKRSEKYREENHLSVAMNLNKKRIDLMASAKQVSGFISIDVQDLYDASGNATGTRVNVSLPLEESI